MNAGLTALLALARYGGAAAQADCLAALDKFPYAKLDREQTLLKLRVLELSFIRQGKPADEIAKREIEQLDALYPADNEDVNHELCQLLLFLEAPDAVAKTVKLLKSAAIEEDQVYYVMRLRTIANGWTPEDRQTYLAWFDKKRDHMAHSPEIEKYFKDLGLAYNEGLSLQPFLDNFRQESLAAVHDNPPPRPPAPVEATNVPTVAPVAPKFVKNWTWKDLGPHLDRVKSGRSFEQGKAAFTSAQCILCHRFGGAGGSVGPELTAVGSRLSARDILESLLEPSKVLPDQYKNSNLTLTSGDDISGRVLQEDADKVVVMTDLIHQTTVEVKKSDIESRRISNVSPMPEGLLTSLTAEEIWDLISYPAIGGADGLSGVQEIAAAIIRIRADRARLEGRSVPSARRRRRRSRRPRSPEAGTNSRACEARKNPWRAFLFAKAEAVIHSELLERVNAASASHHEL